MTSTDWGKGLVSTAPVAGELSQASVTDTGSNMTSGNGLQLDKEPEKKLKYPKSVFFIISNEFCERFSYYGMRSVLALYLKDALNYEESTSTIIYHVFVMLCYFTPIFGGIMADAWLGKFKTILYVSLLYASGNVVLSFGSVETISIPHRELSLLGLLLIAVGTGGIKPCVSSFGGDQFVLPQQERQLQSFFSVFYFSINAGSVISSFLTPKLRELHCLGSDKDCYPLAFGLPAVLMIVAICVFVCGSPMYKRTKPQGNVALDIGGCVSAAVAQKIRSKDKKEHWLDYADHKYSKKLINDIKVLLKLIYLFAPTIVFWALFEQQGSKWTFQASRMNGDLGWYTITPDQMQTLNPVLVLIFIPLFESLIYPFLAKIRLIRTPLQKLCIGGFLAALAFVISGLLEIKIKNELPVLPSKGLSQLNLYNSLPCQAQIDGIIKADLPSFSHKLFSELTPKEGQVKISCQNDWSGNIVLNDAEISSYILISDDKNQTSLFTLTTEGRKDMAILDDSGPRLRVIYGGLEQLKVTIKGSDSQKEITVPNGSHQSKQETLVASGTYSAFVNGKELMKFTLAQGGVYTLMLEESSGKMEGQLFTLAVMNSVSILWQIPQYIVITVSEIMFSITGLEFSYSQSPDSLKSVISSLWLLTDALGNVIILVIEGFQMQNRMVEMLLYAGVMAFAMLIFTFLAIRYKYETPSEDEKNQEVEPAEEQTRI